MSVSSRSRGGRASRLLEKVQIGRVSSPHGLYGEINIVPLTDFPERFASMKSIDLYRGGVFFRTLEVREVRANLGKNTLTLRTDLADRADAQACVGADILIDPEDRVELPPGRFWIDDLIGLRAEDAEGRHLGEVTSVLSAGAHDLYEVRDPDGKTHYIPAVPEFIQRIDLERGLISIALIEGLWE